MVWFPADKIIVRPLIELPAGALVILPKTSSEGQTDFAVRFDLIAESGTQRCMFYPNGLPRERSQTLGWGLNLEDWHDRGATTAAFLDTSDRGMRVECFGEILDAQHADFGGSVGRGRAILGASGVRLLAGNGEFRSRQTFEINPSTWLVEPAGNGPKLGWSDGWRLVFGDLENPVVIKEYMAPTTRTE